MTKHNIDSVDQDRAPDEPAVANSERPNSTSSVENHLVLSKLESLGYIDAGLDI